MKYSPLCDTSPAAYIAYLVATVAQNGSSTFKSVRDAGRGRVDASGGGSDDARGDFVTVLYRILAEERQRLGDVVSVGAVDGICGDVDRLVGVSSRRGAESVAGVASGDDGTGLGSVAGSVRAERCGHAEGNAGEQASAARGLVSDALVSERTLRNREKRHKRAAVKRARKEGVPYWRRNAAPLGGGGVPVASVPREPTPSLSGSVRTVDTRTAAEIEAARTFAERRVVENRIAIAVGKYRLSALGDKSKTDALARLQAARMEERINTAKAKSQASYKKCDHSVNSLGSAGSAGEFALKQEVRRNEQWETKYRYLEAQFDKAFPYIPAEVKQEIADMPEPVFRSAWDVFGDCPSDYDEAERAEYYDQLNRMDEEAHCVESGDAFWAKRKKRDAIEELQERLKAQDALRID